MDGWTDQEAHILMDGPDPDDGVEMCRDCGHPVDNHDLRAMDGECFDCHDFCEAQQPAIELP